MWWMLSREVLRMRGTISREHPWEVMPDLLRLRRRNRLRKLLERRSSRESGLLQQLSSPSLRWLTGLREWLCPSSSCLRLLLLPSQLLRGSLRTGVPSQPLRIGQLPLLPRPLNGMGRLLLGPNSGLMFDSTISSFFVVQTDP